MREIFFGTEKYVKHVERIIISSSPEAVAVVVVDVDVDVDEDVDVVSPPSHSARSTPLNGFDSNMISAFGMNWGHLGV